ncbi:MAG: sugar-binding domain-containing protein, partial [Verrucomicrobiota bacterium]
MKILPIVFLLLSPLSGWALGSVQSSKTLSLDGEDWLIREESSAGEVSGIPATDPGWIPAEVPGNIQGDLEKAHRLNPLWYGAGDPRLGEVATKNWWYRKSFRVPAEMSGQRLRLIFEGLDMEGEVYLNGKMLGRHVGMFNAFAYEVSEQLKRGEENVITVRVCRLPAGLEQWWFKNFAANVNKHYRELKSATITGWDWGVPVYPMGLWRGVRLEATGPVRIENVQIRSTLEGTEQARVQVKVTLDGAMESDLTVECRISGPGYDQTSQTPVVMAQGGQGPVSLDIVIPNPALWWPNGQGIPNLYRAEVRLREGKSGRIFDSKNQRFGIREIRWMGVEGAPAAANFQLVLNGRKITLMGSSVVPPDLLYGRIDSKIDLLIRRARELGLNTLRLWGGGGVFPERFYDLADENGLMLVEEFPLANSYPPSEQDFLDNLRKTVTGIVRGRRNHPSIIEWDGGNEMSWREDDPHPALKVLREVVAENDDRVFRSTCPVIGVTRHSPWWYYHLSHYSFYNKFETPRHGEFGTQSPAHLEVWQREIPVADQWPIIGEDNPVLNRKKAVGAVFEEDFWLVRREMDSLFGPQENLGLLIKAGQFLGADGLRYAFDAHRRSGLRTGGFLSWDLDEPWPNAAGSYLVDHDGRPLMNYGFLKAALAPLSLSLKHESLLFDPRKGLHVELWLSSHAPTRVENLSWEWLVRDRRGGVVGSGKGKSPGLDPISSAKQASIDLALPEATSFGPFLVETRLRDSKEQILQERLQVYGMNGVTGPLGGLLNNAPILPDPDDHWNEISKATPPLNPANAGNLAWIGNGASPAKLVGEKEKPDMPVPAINDGEYGGTTAWISEVENKMNLFVIDLNRTAPIGRVKIGCDRTGRYRDQELWSMKVEYSGDGVNWVQIADVPNSKFLKFHGADKTLQIDFPVVEARMLRVGVFGGRRMVDEIEVYGPTPGEQVTKAKAKFLNDDGPVLTRPIKRTVLQASARKVADPVDDVLELTLTNSGPMTSLFCEPHPMMAYRTDISIENNPCFIPPGESRTMRIRGSGAKRGSTKTKYLGERFSLENLGWRIECWNADPVVIEPGVDVLLTVGRWDQ